MSVREGYLSDSVPEITACQMLVRIFADLLRKHHHLIFIVVNRVARVVHRRDVHRGDLTPRALQDGDQLAPAVRGCGCDNQSIFGDIKIGIDQPAQCRPAERIGIARGQFIRPVRRTEAAAEHIKGLIAYRVQHFGRDIVAEDDHLRLDFLQITFIKP